MKVSTFWWLPVGLICAAELSVANPFASSTIVQQVQTEAERPHAYDWRSAAFELNLGFGSVIESNNFETELYELVGAIPMDNGLVIKAGFRRVNVYSTKSSRLVGRTPFRQSAGVTRYELVGGVGYSLIEGRALSRLSPLIVDVDQVVRAEAAVHYSHPNSDPYPRRKKYAEPKLGQDAVNSTLVFELGLRWQLYLPESVGLYVEWTNHFPLDDTGDLKRWNAFIFGLLYAFGARS